MNVLWFHVDDCCLQLLKAPFLLVVVVRAKLVKPGANFCNVLYNNQQLLLLSLCFITTLNYRLFAIGQWQSFIGLDRRRILFTHRINLLSESYAHLLGYVIFTLSSWTWVRACIGFVQTIILILPQFPFIFITCTHALFITNIT